MRNGELITRLLMELEKLLESNAKLVRDSQFDHMEVVRKVVAISSYPEPN